MENKKILVVGDAPFLRYRLVNDLAYRGYDVRQCAGAAALETLRSLKPQLLILQFPTPIAPDQTLTRAVRGDSALSGTRILNVAHDADEALVESALRAGVDASVDAADSNAILRQVRALIGPAVEP